MTAHPHVDSITGRLITFSYKCGLLGLFGRRLKLVLILPQAGCLLMSAALPVHRPHP